MLWRNIKQERERSHTKEESMILNSAIAEGLTERVTYS